jgi:hypothetical protein
MAPRIANLGQWAYHILDRLARNPALAELHAELVSYAPARLVTDDHLGGLSSPRR